MIRVYLADDHAVLRDGLRFLLEDERDISVVGEAGNGRQAITDVKKLCPDVVLMDIAMPELNGIEATRRIHEICPSSQVIILSIYSSTEYVFRALQAGACGYLLKESAGAEVVKAVRVAHAGQRYFSPKIAETIIEDYVHKGEWSKAKNPLERLSLREREVIQLVVEGKSSKEIGRVFNLSPKSVETYRSRIMKKLKIRDLPGLVKFAIRHGLTSLC